jgi:lactate permease
MGSLIATLLFLQVWRPAPDEEFAIARAPAAPGSAAKGVPPWQGWLPWIIASTTVIVWTAFKVTAVGQHAIPWPGLDKTVSITLYQNKPYAAIWAFQPLGSGTAILLAALITAVIVRLPGAAYWQCVLRTVRQIWLAVVTVMLIVGLAYLMNYSGLAYTLGLAVASSGHAFVLFSPFLGWIAVFLSGSDTGVCVTNLNGKEGAVLARTFVHSIVLTLLLVAIVLVQQYWWPAIIPAYTASH